MCPLDEKEREEFIKYAAAKLGPRLFEQVLGELWLRCPAVVRRIAKKPPELQEMTRRAELSLLVKRIIRGENSFWNREQPRRELPKVVPLWREDDDE